MRRKKVRRAACLCGHAWRALWRVGTDPAHKASLLQQVFSGLCIHTPRTYAGLCRAVQVVAELEVRSRSLALQAASISSERQQLAALEEQRRAALREVEGQMLEEMARLDDRCAQGSAPLPPPPSRPISCRPMQAQD